MNINIARRSLACEPCRVKRRKCDLVKPGCGQCSRQRIACPGYRDRTKLLICDETQLIADKVQAARAKSFGYEKRVSKAGRESIGRHQSQSSSPVPMSLPAALSLTNFSEDLAMSYFMSHYISGSMFESYLPELCSSTYPETHDCVYQATRAVALASFALQVNHPPSANLARARYAKALVETNARIANPQAATQDRTLVSVLLLGLFEALAYEGSSSVNNWTNHIFGVLQLLKLRQQGQESRTGLSQQILTHASYNIRISCIHRNIAVPPELAHIKLEDPDPATAFGDAVIGELGSIVDAFTRLCAQNAATANGQPDAIFTVLELDQELEDVADRLDQMTPVSAAASAQTVPSPYHDAMGRQFPAQRVAKFHNAVCMIRISLNEFIATASSGVESELSSVMGTSTLFSAGCLRRSAADNIAVLGKRILGSVEAHKELKIPGVGSRFMPSARSLFWPLSVLQACTLCPPEIKDICSATLAQLCSDLNCPQALPGVRNPATQEPGLRPNVDW